MGTEVVQTESTQLMASAWQQVEGILKANQTLKAGATRTVGEPAALPAAFANRAA